MENNITIFAVIAVLAFFAILYLVLRILTKKLGNDKVASMLTDMKTGIEKMDAMLESMSAVIPNAATNVVDTILRYAYAVVSAAERMYLNGTIVKEDRKGLASEKIHNMLAMVGIEITPDMEDIIDTSIESAVNSLPKTHPVSKTTKK